MLSAAFLVSLLPLAVFAGNHGSFKSRLSADHHARLARRNSFRVIDLYEGQNFFDGFDFFDQADPTHGQVQYLSRDDAFNKGLAFVDDKNVTFMKVDDYTILQSNQNRNSVRISSKKAYNRGLIIADITAVPTGCSTWPAWWTVGDNWPTQGEIDIMEGVNNNVQNLYTLHTSQGCAVNTSPTALFQTAEAFTGTVLKTQCASGPANGGNNDGCGIQDTSNNTFGSAFNAHDGGVFATLWNEQGIAIYSFERCKIPGDITARQPNPSSWPAPVAFFSASSCNIDQHFQQHHLTFNIALCGDFAGSAYASSGCPGTCAQRVQDPANFKDAAWKVNYVAVYDNN